MTRLHTIVYPCAVALLALALSLLAAGDIYQWEYTDPSDPGLGEQQSITIGGVRFDLRQGESIRTELSHKYRLDAFDAMAIRAGWQQVKTWTDPQEYFAVGYFEATGGDS